jgi:hypothetical protein
MAQGGQGSKDPKSKANNSYLYISSKLRSIDVANGNMIYKPSLLGVINMLASPVAT